MELHALKHCAKIHVKDVKVLVDYKLYMDYEEEKEEEEKSNAEYAKMGIPCQGTLRQQIMHCEMQHWIWHVDKA